MDSKNPHSSPSPLIAKSLLLVLLGAALVIAYIGFNLFRAGLASYQTNAFLDDWAKTGIPKERAWTVALNAAQSANAVYPGPNGEYLDQLGRVYEWRYADQPFGADVAEQSNRSALQAYRDATEVRPHWPYTWSQLSYTKMRLWEFDSEFNQALVTTLETGPWRYQTLAQLAEIGLLAWPKLSSEQQELMREVFSAADQVNQQGVKNRLNRLIVDHNRESVFCAALKEQRRKAYKACTG